MPTSKTTGMIDRFRYAPGDGHVYVWPGTGDSIQVHRITSKDPWTTVDTGDRIDASATAQTADAMRRRVLAWKAARGMIKVETTP